MKNNILIIFSKKVGSYANFLLKKCICPILPVFVLGFVIKMQHEGTLSIIIKEYFIILILVAILAYGYILTLLILLCNNNLKIALTKFKNLLPSVLIGLFSMSSAAAIPSTIEASEKNLKDPKQGFCVECGLTIVPSETRGLRRVNNVLTIASVTLSAVLLTLFVVYLFYLT